MSCRLLQGDALQVLRGLPESSVHCVVTSPPYWGLRDYGTARWEGGDPTCDHRSPTMRKDRNEKRPMLAGSAATNQAQLLLAARTGCGQCGARRVDLQLGLEPTPEEYLAKMVEVFRDVRRVLRDDGTAWVNMGDCYNAATAAPRRPSVTAEHGYWTEEEVNQRINVKGLKPKDLMGMPWRLALALQADGWWLRSDIIWAKPNPMPESVTDRPTKAHEYLFLLSKSERYFYDKEAVREPDSGQGHPRAVLEGQPSLEPSGGLKSPHRGLRTVQGRDGTGRNLRTVWTINTEPYPEAHFATFPKKLVEPCIKAGSKEGDTVLDPFCGSGTTGLVALRHGRNFIGIELSPKYLKLAERRIKNDAPLFNEVERQPAASKAGGL